MTTISALSSVLSSLSTVASELLAHWVPLALGVGAGVLVIAIVAALTMNFVARSGLRHQ